MDKQLEKSVEHKAPPESGSEWDNWSLRVKTGVIVLEQRLKNDGLDARLLKKAIKALPVESLHKIFDKTALHRLGAACDALATGEAVINFTADHYELYLQNPRVAALLADKDGIAKKREEAIKSFAPGGSHFKAYRADVERLREARAEEDHLQAELRQLQARSWRSAATPQR